MTDTRIVTSTSRYKRPPRKRKAMSLAGPAIVRRGTAKPETPPAPANDDRKPVIVTVKRRSSRFSDVPDMTPEEHRRRGDLADALFREIKRRIGDKQRRPRQRSVEDKKSCTGHELLPMAFFVLLNLERGTAMRFFILVIIGLLAACAGPKLPAPNSADVRYDGRDRVVQVMVSNLQPPTAAALVANDGTRYPASGIALVSGPHVLYNPPPSVGLGIGGFGFSGCCSGFGSGIGIGVPVGRPTLAEVSDQCVASAQVPVAPTG